ncbi:hypothetical protein K470DRAFT_82922 [Piedraia hortae CBS 480.64]|uniref:Oxidoreductase-like domain-containing protein n=1 Tax=Piedraia hortae CBS 480.64 TaxID=1314780 RepID=A0A6A7C8I5_9PEZI|nr:hypothetical protein K470DRAFT_82922 [Piedraia hortae CBS 480.64]
MQRARLARRLFTSTSVVTKSSNTYQSFPGYTWDPLDEPLDRVTAKPAQPETKISGSPLPKKVVNEILRGLPPKPEEPDNCCMSGCENCVWNLYRDEMEEWVKQRDKIVAREEHKQGMQLPEGVDGKSLPEDEGGRVLDDLPVGMRAFMEMERKLKEKKERR